MVIKTDACNMVKIVTDRFVVKASTNFCFGEDDEVFRASWNVAMVECASYGSDGSGDGLAKFEDSVERPVGF